VESLPERYIKHFAIKEDTPLECFRLFAATCSIATTQCLRRDRELCDSRSGVRDISWCEGLLHRRARLTVLRYKAIVYSADLPRL